MFQIHFQIKYFIEKQSKILFDCKKPSVELVQVKIIFLKETSVEYTLKLFLQENKCQQISI